LESLGSSLPTFFNLSEISFVFMVFSKSSFFFSSSSTSFSLSRSSFFFSSFSISFLISYALAFLDLG
jgi:hypothetical protein